MKNKELVEKITALSKYLNNQIDYCFDGFGMVQRCSEYASREYTVDDYLKKMLISELTREEYYGEYALLFNSEGQCKARSYIYNYGGQYVNYLDVLLPEKLGNRCLQSLLDKMTDKAIKIAYDKIIKKNDNKINSLAMLEVNTILETVKTNQELIDRILALSEIVIEHNKLDDGLFVIDNIYYALCNENSQSFLNVPPTISGWCLKFLGEKCDAYTKEMFMFTKDGKCAVKIFNLDLNKEVRDSEIVELPEDVAKKQLIIYHNSLEVIARDCVAEEYKKQKELEESQAIEALLKDKICAAKTLTK